MAVFQVGGVPITAMCAREDVVFYARKERMHGALFSAMFAFAVAIGMVLVWYWYGTGGTVPLRCTIYSDGPSSLAHSCVLEKGAAKKKGLARLPNRIARSRSPSGLSVRPSVRPSYNVGTYVCLTKMMDIVVDLPLPLFFFGVSVSFPASLSKFSLAAVFCWLPAFSGARRVHTGVSEKSVVVKRGE